MNPLLKRKIPIDRNRVRGITPFIQGVLFDPGIAEKQLRNTTIEETVFCVELVGKIGHAHYIAVVALQCRGRAVTSGTQQRVQV